MLGGRECAREWLARCILTLWLGAAWQLPGKVIFDRTWPRSCFVVGIVRGSIWTVVFRTLWLGVAWEWHGGAS